MSPTKIEDIFMNAVLKNIIFIIFIFSLQKIVGEGFVAGTLVKAIDDYGPIEEIQLGDSVTCWGNTEGNVIRQVIGLRSYRASELIKLFFDNNVIVCEKEQSFYLAEHLGWCKARDLKVGDCIRGFLNDSIVQKIERLNEIEQIYEITVEDTHTFYVSESGLLVHNWVFVLPILAWGGGAAVTWFEGVTVAGVIGTIAGIVIKEVAADKIQKATGKDVRSIMKSGEAIIQDIAQNQKNNNFEKSRNCNAYTTSRGSAGNGGNGGCICGCGPCNAGCNCGCFCGCGKQASIFENNSKHIFRNAPGHLSDTPEHRQLLLDLVAESKNCLGVDKYGNHWFAKTLANGTQIWASVRNNCIRNGGLNKEVKIFDSETGLSCNL